jgi:aminoglycoside/choline kinase family phosphotransferase
MTICYYLLDFNILIASFSFEFCIEGHLVTPFPETARDLIALHFEIPRESIRLIPLPGDASDRRFYRALLAEGTSLIIMQLETELPAPADPDKVPYINVLYHLSLCHCHVPKLHRYDPTSGILLLEDLGERTLEDMVQEQGVTASLPLYRKAIDELLILQITGTRKRCKHCLAFHSAFDEEKLMWELNFFREHTLEGYLNRAIPSHDCHQIEIEFQKLCGMIAAEPRYLSHRDYHSRNLMVRDGRIGIVDFQDARLGPLQYDLVSLLRDSYVVLPEDAVDQLIEYYIQERDLQEGTRTDSLQFRRVFDLVSVQRNLKAAGTFGYMATAKGKDQYLKYLPDTFHYVRQNLNRLDELQGFKKSLAPYLPEIL